MRPHTFGEWAIYIRGLGPEDLYSQAVAANTHTFARTMVSEGFSMIDVEHKILLPFVRELRAKGVKVPEGGAFDLVTMALVDEVARVGVTYSPEEVALVKSLAEPQDDDLVAFEQEAARG